MTVFGDLAFQPSLSPAPSAKVEGCRKPASVWSLQRPYGVTRYIYMAVVGERIVVYHYQRLEFDLTPEANTKHRFTTFSPPPPPPAPPPPPPPPPPPGKEGWVLETESEAERDRRTKYCGTYSMSAAVPKLPSQYCVTQVLHIFIGPWKFVMLHERNWGCLSVDVICSSTLVSEGAIACSLCNWAHPPEAGLLAVVWGLSSSVGR